jgi:hypothetical protein
VCHHLVSFLENSFLVAARLLTLVHLPLTEPTAVFFECSHFSISIRLDIQTALLAPLPIMSSIPEASVEPPSLTMTNSGMEPQDL